MTERTKSMEEKELNAESAEVVQPQNMGADTADTAHPQVNIDDMTDEEFFKYLETAQTDEADEPKPVNMSETAEQTAENTDDVPKDEKNVANEDAAPFKVYRSQEEWQSEIDGIIGKRLKSNRIQTENYNKILSIAEDFYGKENALEGLMKDLRAQAAEKRSISPDEYAERIELEQKARLYEEQAAIAQAQEKQAQTLRSWQTQSEELRKTVPDFDFEKELSNKEFYDRIVKGYSVADAYNLTKKTAPPVPVSKRKPVAQGALYSQAGGSQGEIDISKMSDKEFDDYLKKCYKE